MYGNVNTCGKAFRKLARNIVRPRLESTIKHTSEAPIAQMAQAYGDQADRFWDEVFWQEQPLLG